MRRSYKNRLLSGIVSAAVLLSCGQSVTASEPNPSEIPLKDLYTFQSDAGTEQVEITYPDYTEYQAGLSGFSAYAGETVAAEGPFCGGEKVELAAFGEPARDALVWEDADQSYEWHVTVPETGLYQLKIGYHCADDYGAAAVRRLLIDGEQPFEEAASLTFLWNWNDDGTPERNNVGDDVVPQQVLIPQWNDRAMEDSAGRYNRPLLFALEKGEHVLSLEYIDQPLAISGISLTAPADIPAYVEVAASYAENGYTEASAGFTFEAENSVADKNDSTLRQIANDDPKSVPHETGYRRLNAIGDAYWKSGQQTITWEFEVPEAGLYKIGMRVGQWYNAGLPVYRQVRIDGEIPFAEMECYQFEYSKDWRAEFLHDEAGEPYLFYLEPGLHTLSMAVKLGDYTPILSGLTDDMNQLSDITLKITMLTGPTPDPNYEYELVKNIPGLLETFQAIADSLRQKIDRLKEISNQNSNAATSLEQSWSTLNEFISRPDTIHKKMTDLTNIQTNISNWYVSLQDQPMVIDYFMIYPEGQKAGNVTSNFFQKAAVSFQNFLTSFTKDYDSVGNVFDESGEAVVLDVWTTRGSERAEVLKYMADESFTGESNIFLNLNVVPADQMNAGAVNVLMLSIVSGRAPDVALGVGTTSPVEFAFRDAACDLTAFADYKETESHFLEPSMIPFTFQDKVYALPETMDFRVLFYREDIIGKIGARIPDTWNDLLEYTLPVLYQNKMTFYLPNDYATFLFQNGGQYYTDDGLASALDSPEAYTAFKTLTDMYTSYGLPVTTNFFSRFRTGDVPMGIGGFNEYMQIGFAAPELAGKWNIVPIPGTVREDGSVDRTFAGSVSSASMILNDSDKKDAAWEFMKWWASTETQIEYSRQLESLLGPQGKWNTANYDAYPHLSWNRDDLEVVMKAFENVEETPAVLGGYFSSRHFTNAWNRIIVDSDAQWTIRDSLEQAVEDINKELVKKQEEYAHLLD